MNVTHLQHALIALLLQIIILVATWAAGGPNVLAAYIAGPCLFFGREQWGQSLKLKGSGPLTWRITIQACAFWRWGKDSYFDLIAPMLAPVPLSIIAWSFA